MKYRVPPVLAAAFAVPAVPTRTPAARSAVAAVVARRRRRK